jgi:hypothetical protein
MESSTIRGDINDLDINYLILIVFTRYRVLFRRKRNGDRIRLQ